MSHCTTRYEICRVIAVNILIALFIRCLLTQEGERLISSVHTINKSTYLCYRCVIVMPYKTVQSLINTIINLFLIGLRERRSETACRRIIMSQAQVLNNLKKQGGPYIFKKTKESPGLINSDLCIYKCCLMSASKQRANDNVYDFSN